MSEEKKDQSEIAVVRRGDAPKASGSNVGYEIGRERGTTRLLIRIVRNDGGGTFSKEFVPMEAIRRAVDDVGGKAGPFRGGEICQKAYKGKSRNNGPFLAYALRGEGLLALAGENESKVVVAGDWDAWEKKVRSLPMPDPPPPPSIPPAIAEVAKPTPQADSSPKEKRTKKKPAAAAADQGAGENSAGEQQAPAETGG